jgi:hypothetical protein
MMPTPSDGRRTVDWVMLSQLCDGAWACLASGREWRDASGLKFAKWHTAVQPIPLAFSLCVSAMYRPPDLAVSPVSIDEPAGGMLSRVCEFTTNDCVTVLFRR